MNRPLLLASMSLLAACGPASVSGTVGGAAIDSSDAIAEKTSVPVLGDALHVVIGGDSADLCADFAAGTLRKGSSRLDLLVAKIGKTLQAGTYDVGNDLTNASAVRLDTACGDVLKRSASSGTVTITAILADRIDGEFRLNFDADEVEGSFQARLCANTSVTLKTCQ